MYAMTYVNQNHRNTRLEGRLNLKSDKVSGTNVGSTELFVYRSHKSKHV